MRAAVISTAKRRLECHGPLDPGFLIKGFFIQCLHRSGRRLRAGTAGPRTSSPSIYIYIARTLASNTHHHINFIS
eukprot:2337777-Pyramimonas_sp.AAC.1